VTYNFCSYALPLLAVLATTNKASIETQEEEEATAGVASAAGWFPQCSVPVLDAVGWFPQCSVPLLDAAGWFPQCSVPVLDAVGWFPQCSVPVLDAAGWLVSSVQCAFTRRCWLGMQARVLLLLTC
jgi:hypothetical protein